MDASASPLRLTYRLDAKTEGQNRLVVAEAIGRLQAVRRALGAVQFDVPQKHLAQSRSELTEVIMELVKLKARL